MWRLDTDLEMSSKAFVIAHFACFSVDVFSHYLESHRKAMLLNIITLIIIRSKFFFLFIGQEPTTWPANNCLQIMVCSCAMPSNCVWLQIIFCSCVKETLLFAFLRSLLPENGRLLRFPKIFIKKTNLEIEWYSVIAKYRDLSVSRTSIICLSFWLWQIIDLLATEKSRYFAQPCAIIVKYLEWFS